MILLTGGTGFTGSYILYYLLQENASVRAIRRRGSSEAQTKFIFRQLSGLEPSEESWQEMFDRIAWVEADINDATSLEDAMDGIDMLFHAAAHVSFHAADRKQIIKTNVEGTANVVDVALDKGIKKMAYVSSVAALARRDAGTMSEADKVETRDFSNVYSESKYRAEMEVWRGHTEGLSATMINPSVILGWGDFTKGSAAIFNTIGKGLKLYPTGSNSYVDVRDVARALIALSKREDAYGQRFVAASSNIAYKDFFAKIARELEAPVPSIPAGSLLRNMAWMAAGAQAFITREKPFLTRDIARTSGKSFSYNAEKLQQFLDFSFIPLEKTIADTAKAYKDWSSHGLK